MKMNVEEAGRKFRGNEDERGRSGKKIQGM